jgi:hypothetical protein
VKALVEKLAAEGILAGIELSRWTPGRDRDLLICVTERHSRGALDRLVAALS